MSDDIICQIVRGELEAHVVARTERAIAFLDHRPLFKGHVLVAPIEHADTLVDLPVGSLEPVFGLAQRVAAVMPEALGAQGTFVAVNTVVSQSVPHLHVHVVPRTKGDGLRGFFWPRVRYGEGEAAQFAGLLRVALG
ncbi:HIT family protein [Aestuariimicrobium ganziense]|uniref:HIT family protein n=1 Tax=Aestuariimicrobium ganziense TaxID=2773677 RepID=UPI0019431AFA|nr:HIT family protein [Aestuariimicrobium ganziense]